MKHKLTFKAAIHIKASTSKVWQALTDPELIKEYLFGTHTITDWKKGSPITYTGTWEGKTYTDKGMVVEINPEQLLHTTYFSFMSGKEDKPENYAHVIYELSLEDGGTLLTLSQDNIDDEAQLKHMEQNWSMVMGKLKNVVEK